MVDLDLIHPEINKLINQPWTRDKNHCWRLVVEVVGLFGYQLPAVIEAVPKPQEKQSLFKGHQERTNWREVDEGTLAEWAVVLMYKPWKTPVDLEHAGVWLRFEGGKVLHSDAPHGVVLDSLVELRALRRWVPLLFVPNKSGL